MIKDHLRKVKRIFKNFLLILVIYPSLKKRVCLSVKDIKILPFKILSWHHGSCYFLCKTEEKKYFIKTDLKFRLLQNEQLCEQLFKKKYPNMPLLEISFIDLDYQYVAYEYIELPTLGEFFCSPKCSEKIRLNLLNELMDFLEALYQMNIVYRDIKMDNFFVGTQGNVIFLDFSFAISKDESVGLKELVASLENEKVLRYMGVLSQKESFYWDDALGMFNLLCELELLSGLDLSSFKEKTKVNMGRIVYKYSPVYFSGQKKKNDAC